MPRSRYTESESEKAKRFWFGVLLFFVAIYGVVGGLHVALATWPGLFG